MTTNQRSHERGQSLPELALSMTLLMMLLLGAFDFGRAFFAWIGLRDAAQEGAAYGSSSGNLCAGVTERALETSSGPTGMLASNPASISVNCQTPDGCSAGDPIIVTTSFPNFPITTPFLGSVLGTQSITIRATIRDTILVPGTCP